MSAAARRRLTHPFRLVAFSLLTTVAALTAATAQPTVIVTPSTISTYAGGPLTTPTAVGAGKLCNGNGTPASGNTLPVATDALNDGCPAAQAIFSTGSADNRGGIGADAFGNLYILDGGNGGNNVLRKIDARSGIISLVAGGTITLCSASSVPAGTPVDKEGDGCPLVTTTGGVTALSAGGFNNPRGMGVDPYGNVVIAGYSDGLVHLVCTAVSPLCTAAQVNTMRVAAGCTTTSTAYGTGGTGADNVSATPNGTCSTSVGEINQPRGAAADAFGNVYVGETAAQRYRIVLGPQTYNGVTNPLWATIGLNSAYGTLSAGKIYTISNVTTAATTAGGFCTGTSGAKALDAYGDGCPYYLAKIASSSGSLQAIAGDSNGNVFFYDYSNTGLVRVLYGGGSAVAATITANNTANTNYTGTPVVGSVYIVAGGGSTGPSVETSAPYAGIPILGTTANLSAQVYKMTLDPKTGDPIIASGTNILILDLNTGYLHKVATSGANCTAAQNAYGVAPNGAGDGCPANAATYGDSNGTGVAMDNLGNLFLADSTNSSIRKIAAGSYTSVTAGSSYTPNFLVHSEFSSSSTSNVLAANTDFTIGAAACTANPSTNSPPSDNSVDCISTVTFHPTELGLRSAPVAVASTNTSISTVTSALTGIGSGVAITFDPASPALPSTSTLGAVTGATGVAVDGAGNVYTTGTVSGNKTYTEISNGTATSISTPVNLPSQIAVDPQGNVYGAVGTATITKLSLVPPSTYGSTSVSNSATANVKAIAVDANENVYVADTTNNIIKFSQSTGQAVTLTAGALNNPVSIALDYAGNVLVADLGAGVVYKLPVGGGALTTAVSSVSPIAVAADPAGDIYYVDSNTKSVVMIPVSGAATTVLTGLISPTGLAVDGLGNVFVSDSGATGVIKVNRSAYSYAFASTSATLTGTLTNVGNVTATGFNQSDASDFQLANSGATCVPTATSIPAGTACTINANFTPQGVGGGTLTNVVSLKPTASNFGGLTLSGTVSGNTVTTTTVIGAPSPTPAVYLASGTEVTFTLTVTASNGNPTGSVNVSVDSGASVSYSLTASTGNTATATVSLSGLIAATHTISAAYPTTGAYTGSNSGTPTSFTITQAATAITWSPATLSLGYSQAIGTGVFDAVAKSSGAVVPGTYVYTATPSGGSAQMVDSATYLAIGTYALAVTFTPTDAVDYSGSSQSLVGTLTVGKATTTAAVGASMNVVAADGSGNYTSVETAVTALGSSGGSVYLAPGTYHEQVLVAYPNVALRGLGGNAANVVLTSETGAYAQPPPSGVTANPFGFNNDEGSATLVVAKGTVGGTSYTPTNFYMDNLSLVNTFDTDAANANGITGSNQSCTGTSTSSNNSLFYAGTLCASQALTLWITADKTVVNHVQMMSLQDTLAAYNTTGSNACAGIACSSRQYYWKNYITGDIDYVFGDAAAVFDQTSFYTQYHGNPSAVNGNTANATVFAQNKYAMTGSASDYLSGYVANNSAFTSQSTPQGAMTALYYGRPYGVYSTTVLINNSVDDVAAAGWESFSGANLATSTYIEYGTTGAGASTIGQRETTSIQPSVGTAAIVARYAPITFLSTPSPDVWDPSVALTAGVNGYVPSGSSATINYGQSITILAKPQTPGGGAIPTGTFTLLDAGTQVASGSLDASGAMYLTSKTFAVGSHSFTFTYSGDSNFNGFTTTATPFALTVNGTSTTTTLAVTTATPTYGQAVAVQATVTPVSGSAPTGTVNLTVDSGTPIAGTLSNGVATFSLTGLSSGAHTLSATYVGAGADTASTGNGSVTLAKAVLTVTAVSISRAYQTANSYNYTTTGFQNNDPRSVTSGVPVFSTTAQPNSPAATYALNLGLGSLAATNYTFSLVAGTITVQGGVSQSISFGALPPIPHGNTVPLFARTTSGLPVTYTVTGAATIVNGNRLMVTGTGTITVTAAQSGNATFNSATSVSRSFTAQ